MNEMIKTATRALWHCVTSMRPCRMRTNMARAKCTLHADGSRRLRNADDAIAPPNILQTQPVCLQMTAFHDILLVCNSRSLPLENI